MNDAMKQIAVKYGSYLALINIAYLLYVSYWYIGIYSDLAWYHLVFLWDRFGFLQLENLNKAMTDISLRKRFQPISNGHGYTYWNLIYITPFLYIDPQFAADAMDMIVEVTMERFESSGLSDEQIDEIIGRIEGSNPFGVAGQLKSAAFS